jgi:sarcosine oxidase subunit alpha
MSTRLQSGGRLIDRTKQIEFKWNGKRLTGFKGDTLASALLANDQMMVGRSFKYHRPRGIIAAGPEEPNALMGTGVDGHFEPNQRATTTELYQGLNSHSQNHWPSLEFDIGAINSKLPRFFPAGFYYKTFMYPRAAWKHVFEPIIRKSAGLGKAPTHKDDDTYEYFYAHVDIMIVGGGIAGLAAALTAGQSGASVLLMEQGVNFGGRAVTDGVEIDGKTGCNLGEKDPCRPEKNAQRASKNPHDGCRGLRPRLCAWVRAADRPFRSQSKMAQGTACGAFAPSGLSRPRVRLSAR